MSCVGVLQATDDQRLLLAAGLYAATGRVAHELLTLRDEAYWETHAGAILHAAVAAKAAPMWRSFIAELQWRRCADLDAVCSVFNVTSRLLCHGIASVAQLMTCADRPMILLKGAALALETYDPSLPRMMNDLDVLVRPPDIDFVMTAFARSGCIQGHFDRAAVRLDELADVEKSRLLREHYELAPFLRITLVPELAQFVDPIRMYLAEYSLVALNGDVYFAEEYDVHFNISMGVEVEDLWREPRAIKLPDGTRLAAQTWTDALWFLAARGYHEIILADRPVLRLFVDILAILHAHGAEIDWGRFTGMAAKYELRPALFYMLWHANELLGPVVPLEVLAFCDPELNPGHRSHDWGDFMPKLLGRSYVTPVKMPSVAS